MAAPRSPNYPQVGLSHALADIKKVADKDDRNKISAQAVAAHLGYSTLNGSAMVALSVLKKYGLLDGKLDKFWVSDTAYKILHAPQGSAERREAVRKAALTPALFAELRKEFPDSLPSQEALRYHLIQKKFNVEAAEKAAKAYRETMTLVTGGDNGHNEAEGSEKPDSGGSNMEGQQEKLSARPPGQGGRSVETPPPPLVGRGVVPPDEMRQGEGGLFLQVPFRGSVLTVRIDTQGERLTKAHVSRVRDFLVLAEEDLAPEQPRWRNPRSRRMKEAVDVSEFPRTPEGYYTLPPESATLLSEMESPDFCDAKEEAWIWSIGRHRQTGEIHASKQGDLYENPAYECLWLR